MMSFISVLARMLMLFLSGFKKCYC